ncbi:MAG: outer membrane protein assembly factor BamD [Kordiimonadaceae bacterium]|nr:outer membrane protein assembly factor BamD [Kordiimonadaceae bacterium]MBT6036460.1 outer membrane protein assembly factor BamD [Kordiimonadaceae bacterium]MBT6328355.1 outer membrane protein assembly factor BamD [Kordiimonadaceae bacterium]MBT7581742.1 outer membrane protein assembly factor BamD [Kordiimonadaceae bacterium]
MRMKLSTPFSLIAKGMYRMSAIVLASIIITACSGDTLKYQDLPVDQLYIEAQKYMDQKQYRYSAVAFDEVERQHPYSVWARRAQLMSAYSYYMSNEYEDAILAAERFLLLHPGNANAPYARYLVALSYYEQIADVRRDQNNTEQALSAFEQIVRLHPSSNYAKDARIKIELTNDHLAGKEMEIGRFYQTTGELFAAIGRFNNVVKSYETTSHAPEALHRITEAYLALGIVMEAEKSASVLALNYPNSDWNRYSSELLQKHRN